MNEMIGDDMILVIDSLGGNCPVQAEGVIDGKLFYFRSRGSAWSFSVDEKDPVCDDPEWEHQEDYGTWPDAGWITEDQAREFIAKAAGLYRASQQSEIVEGKNMG